MSKFAIVILGLGSGMAQAEINLESTKSQMPIIIEVVGKLDLQWIGGIDKNTKTRIWVHSTKNVYNYVTPAGNQTKEYPLLPEEAQSLRAHLQKASASCPLTFHINKETFKIMKVKTDCDSMTTEMAMNNFGDSP